MNATFDQRWSDARLVCPTHAQPLESVRGEFLCCPRDGEEFPVIDGIPVLLPVAIERQRIVDAMSGGGEDAASAADFYNRQEIQEQYWRENSNEERQRVEQWSQKAQGPMLEIGSGKGALQGIGGDHYVAADYSLAALGRHIAPRYRRVCVTAEALPFADQTFGFVFSITAFEHVPEADKAFEEVARVLKPGGIAYLAPAWHCVQYNCEGIPVRPYRDLSIRQRFIKATLPLRRQAVIKALGALPRRIARRTAWKFSGGGETRFQFRRLRPDYQTFWLSDSDACSRLDSHEAALYFSSRQYDVFAPGSGLMRQLLARAGPLIVRKPTR